MHDWHITNEQREERVRSTRTYKKVFKSALTNGLSAEKAMSAAREASQEALNRKVPGWEHGKEGLFSGLFV